MAFGSTRPIFRARISAAPISRARSSSAARSLRPTSGARADLTGSFMPGAGFEGALLYRARLAEIEWERASLRRADLRQATFHYGSSRSGLVGSPLASEGTRTGFYTNEALEPGRPPEEI